MLGQPSEKKLCNKLVREEGAAVEVEVADEKSNRRRGWKKLSGTN